VTATADIPEPAVDRPESRNRQIVQPGWGQCVAEAVATRLGCDLDVEPTPPHRRRRRDRRQRIVHDSTGPQVAATLHRTDTMRC